MAEVGVRRGDADGLACFQRGAEDWGEQTTPNSTRLHLLEVTEGLILSLRGGNGHCKDRRSQYHKIYHTINKTYQLGSESFFSSLAVKFTVVMSLCTSFGSEIKEQQIPQHRTK